MNLNILLRGQSNSVLFDSMGGAAAMQAEVEKLLGFDGKTNTVTLIADYGNANGNNTMNSGTAFLTEWLKGDPSSGWQVNTLEQGLLNDIAAQSDAVKASPTAVVWLHNEYDSQNPGLTADYWESAVEYDAALVRQALGQSAETVPYLFVNAIPYSNSNSDSNQQIKIGMQELADTPGFNAEVAAQFNDVNMDYYNSGMGGAHMGSEDVPQLADRLARSIAETFAQYAQPGSPVALANGDIDSTGPQVVQASAVDGHPNQVLLTIGFDEAHSLQPLDSVAASGANWYVNSSVSAYGGEWATGAQLVDGNHLLLTFANDVPANGLVFYGYGYGKVWASDGTGVGHGIYDDQGMPLWTQATGVQIGAPAVGMNGSEASIGGSSDGSSDTGLTDSSFGSGSDTLVLKISEDAWQGDAQYIITVDGQQLGGTLTAHASHAAGQDETITLHGNWGAGAHTVTVNFLNDAYNGTPDTDRNLHVDSISYNGQEVANGSAALLSAGPQDITVPASGSSGGAPSSSVTLGSGSDSFVLKISQDAWQGSAQYTVSVDGQQVGGTQTATAQHGSGAEDLVTVQGNWGAGAHTVEVNFLNDAYNGTPATDRNLYVDGMSYNGHDVAGGSASLLSAGPHDFAVAATDGTTGSTSSGSSASGSTGAVDWNALAALAQANFEATGHWFI